MKYSNAKETDGVGSVILEKSVREGPPEKAPFEQSWTKQVWKHAGIWSAFQTAYSWGLCEKSEGRFFSSL